MTRLTHFESQRPAKTFIALGPGRLPSVEFSQLHSGVLILGAGMKRRELLGAIGGAAFWLASRAQQPKLSIIGFLNPRSKLRGEPVAAAFRRGLQEAGYEEGRNVIVEYRWAEDQYDRLPLLAADLVARNVSAVVAGGSPWLAAKKATTTIPIVFTTGLDPVTAGMVKSINRPEANLTGVSF